MAKKIWTSLDFDRNSTIEEAGRVYIHSLIDHINLHIKTYATSQTSDVIQVVDSADSPIFKITGTPIIEFYKDCKTISSHHIYSNHSTRIISGLYVTPLLYGAILSGVTNANSTRITGLAIGTGSSDAVNVGQLNSTISGHMTASDPHSQYIYYQPTTTARNRIETFADCVALTVAGSFEQAANIFEVYDTIGGSLLFSVTPTGLAQTNGISNADAQIINLGAGTALKSAVNVNQMNLSVSGLLTATATFTNKTLSGQVGDFFCGPQLGIFCFTNPANYKVLAIDGIAEGSTTVLSNTVYPSINRKCRAKEISVSSSSLSVTSGWFLVLYKNDAGCGTFPFTVGSYPTNSITSGFWTPMAGADLDFNPGDRFHVAASGFNANALIVYANPGWETR